MNNLKESQRYGLRPSRWQLEKKEKGKTGNRYSYPQLEAIKLAQAPGQDSIGTGGQNSVGANKL